MTLQTQRVRTLEQVRAFVEGSESVDFAEGDREGAYALARRTLVQLGYHRLDNAEQYLAPGTAFEDLNAAAHAVSDLQAAEALNRARAALFLSIEAQNSAAA